MADNRFFMTVLIVSGSRTRLVRALLDTGASGNCIAQHVIVALRLENAGRPTSRYITNSHGDRHLIHAEHWLAVSVLDSYGSGDDPDPLQFYAADYTRDSGFEMILGIEWWVANQLRCSVNWHARIIRWKWTMQGGEWCLW
jgi:hypothetical protein